jgi:hypothetical protein
MSLGACRCCFGEPFDVLRAVSGSAELTVEAQVEPLSRVVIANQE